MIDEFQRHTARPEWVIQWKIDTLYMLTIREMQAITTHWETPYTPSLSQSYRTSRQEAIEFCEWKISERHDLPFHVTESIMDRMVFTVPNVDALYEFRRFLVG